MSEDKAIKSSDLKTQEKIKEDDSMCIKMGDLVPGGRPINKDDVKKFVSKKKASLKRRKDRVLQEKNDSKKQTTDDKKETDK